MCADPHLRPQDHICLLDVFCTSKSQNDFVVTGFVSRLLIHVLGLVFIHKRVTETLIARTAEFPSLFWKVLKIGGGKAGVVASCL